MGQTDQMNEKTLITFIAGDLNKVKPLQKEAALVHWKVPATGREGVLKKIGRG
jgi:hypothetical protein